jgi:integrase
MSNQLANTLPVGALAAVGEIANAHASAAAFDDYMSRKAPNTIRRQRDDLANFAQYLAAVSIQRTADDLQTSPTAWAGMTWGIVAGYREWMKRAGNAIAVINLRLSTVRTYCKLAVQAGAIPAGELAMIRTVNGYSRSEGANIDQARDVQRIGSKKANANVLTPAQIKALRDRPGTPSGRRDAVLIGLLVSLGLRVGEVTTLSISSVDLTAGTINVKRPKVKKTQVHHLRAELADAMRSYVSTDLAGAPAQAPLLRASRKGGELTHAGMTRFAIAQRVRHLGEEIGVSNLSPHDLRHTWATRAAANKTDPFALRDAGGWSSLAMPARYVDEAKIANEGVKLDD